MTIQLVRVEPEARTVAWSVQSPTPGVVLLDFTIEGRAPWAPLHWRAGLWSKPPLDLSLDAAGQLVALQFALQDERVLPGEATLLAAPETGLPVFDVNEWPSERYRDEKIPVEPIRTSSGDLVVRIGPPRPLARVCGVVPGLLMAFTDVGNLAEIRLGPLDREDWAAIDAFSLVD